MKEKKTLFSVQMSAEDKEKLQKIAEHQGVSKAGVLRGWIRRSYKRLEAGK